MVLREVGYNSKCTYWTIQDSSIKLGNNVSSSPVTHDDDHETKVMQPHFSIQGLFEASVADQHEASGCKIVIFDLGGMLVEESIHMG